MRLVGFGRSESPVTKEELLEMAKSLPRDERIDLVMALWDSIAAEGDDLPLTEAQKQELDRRIAADEADPAAAIPWEQVRKQILGGE
jgi:putative addiction module component (TIGR02574 family)